MMKTNIICVILALSMFVSSAAMAGYAGTHDEQSNRTEKLLFKAIGAAVVGAGALAYKEHKAREREGTAELDGIREEEKAGCPSNAPYGPYYRYELDYRYVIQARERGVIYGKRPNNDGHVPTCQAFRKRRDQDNEVKFCTPVRPHPGGGPIQSWYLGKTPGVLEYDEDTAMIPIVIVD